MLYPAVTFGDSMNVSHKRSLTRSRLLWGFFVTLALLVLVSRRFSHPSPKRSAEDDRGPDSSIQIQDRTAFEANAAYSGSEPVARKHGNGSAPQMDPRVRKVIAQVESSLKSLEHERSRIHPLEVSENRQKLKIVLPAPSLEEIAQMSQIVSAGLESLPLELRQRHRRDFQAVYDEYASFPNKFKLIECVAVNLGAGTTTFMMAVNADDLQNSNRGSGREYIIDNDHPVDSARFGHILPRD